MDACIFKSKGLYTNAYGDKQMIERTNRRMFQTAGDIINCKAEGKHGGELLE